MKIQKFNAQLINDTFFPNDTSSINSGRCFMWAYLAHLVFVKVEIWHNDGHAFVRHNKLFYDADKTKGVKDWHDLPAASWLDHSKRTNIKNFKKEWKSQPPRFMTSWKKIEKRATDVLKNYHVK